MPDDASGKYFSQAYSQDDVKTKNFYRLDPNEVSEINMANSRFNVRKLIKDGLILRKPQVIHSRARVRKNLEAKRKGKTT